MATQWLVTDVSPRWAPYLEPVGWKLHAVAAEDADTVESTKKTPAACGLRARYGWTVDLFIPEKERDGNRCRRCVRALAPSKGVA